MRKPRIGEKVSINTIPSLVGKEVTIKSFLLDSVFVRQKFGREDIEVNESDLVYLEPIKLLASQKIDIIKRLVKPDCINNILALRKEQGVLNRLVGKYNDADFWLNLELGFQLKSLVWFFGSGSDQIRIRFSQFALDKSQATCNNSPITLREEKIGADVPIVNKPKNLLDILN